VQRKMMPLFTDIVLVCRRFVPEKKIASAAQKNDTVVQNRCLLYLPLLVTTA